MDVRPSDLALSGSKLQSCAGGLRCCHAPGCDGHLQLCGRDLGRPIQSCPEWTAADLQQHIIDTFRGQIGGFGEDELDPFLAVDRAVTLLQDPQADARDLAHECAVHRWDAATAFGVDYAIEPELACDGIDGFFEAAWPMWLDYFKRPAGSGETLRLRESDGPGRWRVGLENLPVVHHDDLPGDVEVVGSASQLVLWLWGRSDPPQVVGDRRVLEKIRNPHGRFVSPGF